MNSSIFHLIIICLFMSLQINFVVSYACQLWCKKTIIAQMSIRNSAGFYSAGTLAIPKGSILKDNGPCSLWFSSPWTTFGTIRHLPTALSASEHGSVLVQLGFPLQASLVASSTLAARLPPLTKAQAQACLVEILESRFFRYLSWKLSLPVCSCWPWSTLNLADLRGSAASVTMEIRGYRRS